MGTLWTKIKGSTGGNKEGGKEGVSRGGSIRGSKKSNKGGSSKHQKKKESIGSDEGATADVKDVVIKEKIVEDASKESVKKEGDEGATAKEDKDDSDKEEATKESTKEDTKHETAGEVVKEKVEEKVADPKLIAVFGATGHQGGALVRALKTDPSFKIRALTRNPGSDKAKALSEQGLDVVEADLTKPDTLTTALDGAYGVFVVTDSEEHTDTDQEIQQGKNAADACKAKGVQHVVFSSSPSSKELIGEPCAYVEAKPVVNAYMKELGLPLTSVVYGFYCESLLTTVKPQKGEDGVYCLLLPMEGKPLEMVPVDETGECIRQVFRNKDTFLGRTLSLASDRATIAEYADTLTRCLDGPKFKATEMTTKQYAELKTPQAEEIAILFRFLQSPKYSQDISLTKSLHPNIPNFEGWVKKNKDKILSALD